MQFDLLSKNVTERSGWLAEGENEAETRPVFLLVCCFTANIAILLLYTINPVS